MNRIVVAFAITVEFDFIETEIDVKAIVFIFV